MSEQNVKSRIKLSKAHSERIDKALEDLRTMPGEIARLRVGDESIVIDKPTVEDVTPSQLDAVIFRRGRKPINVTVRRDIDHRWVVCRD